ncbi:MAG: DUF2970 domain-containing protein [Gammaproteobacteria bacterium]
MSNAPPPPTLLQLLGSVLSAFFGVQNSRNRERDFKHGKPHQFIILGLLATVAFITLVVVLVKVVTGLVGA